MTGLFAKRALTPAGWQDDVRVVIGADGRIASVTPGGPPGVDDRRLGILLPAPANLHSHAFQRAMAGLTEARGPDGSDSFWTWRRLMFRFLERLAPEDVEAIAAFVQMEMLEAGYAAVGEFHYLHHRPDGRPYARIAEMSERICAAAAETGIGLTLLPVLYQQGGADGRPLGPGQVRFGTDPDGFARLHGEAARAVAALPGDAGIGVAPHSLRAVDREGLAAAAALAGRGPVHMHLAEQVAEVAEVEACLGARPVTWALDHLDLGPRWCLIHCTQMEPTETERLAASGAVAGLCPITEANLGDGIFDGARFLGAGGRVGIGSDSNIRVALWEELRTLEYGQRLRDRARAVLATSGLSTGRRLFEAAARGGAQALDRETGAIEAGRWADLVALDPDGPDLAGRSGDAILDALVFAAAEGALRDVWSAGRHLVAEGRHLRRAAIGARYRAAMERIGAAI